MDIYSEVTNRIMEQMEQGIIPWQKPWVACGKAISRTTGKPYSLLNQMLLGRPGEYLTFRQCQEAGGKVKKGEKSQMVVFWKWIETEDEETGEKKEVPFLRYYNVFHIDQCEGVTAKHTAETAFPDGAAADEAAQGIIADYLAREQVRLSHQEGDRAFYRPGTDEIVLPLMKQFHSTAEYYSTAFHEITHSTGHEKRLNRLTRAAFFGTEDFPSVTTDLKNTFIFFLTKDSDEYTRVTTTYPKIKEKCDAIITDLTNLGIDYKKLFFNGIN